MSFHHHIAEILPLIDRQTDSVMLIKRGNDVFRLISGTESFFLKVYTKDWYGPDPASTGFHVNHEGIAWAILAQNGLAVPIVAHAAPDCENPISRPFLLTRELEGRPLTDWLMDVDQETQFTLLSTVGAYLRQCTRSLLYFQAI